MQQENAAAVEDYLFGCGAELGQRDFPATNLANVAIACGKARYVPLHGVAADLIGDYLKKAGHGEDDGGALFRRVYRERKRPVGRDGPKRRCSMKAITPDGVYRLVRFYSTALGFEIGAHSLRTTAATNALDHEADISKVQEWLGHANISTTRIYDHRKTRPEDSPTFKITY